MSNPSRSSPPFDTSASKHRVDDPHALGIDAKSDVVGEPDLADSSETTRDATVATSGAFDYAATDASVVAAAAEDETTPYDLAGLAEATGATITLLESVERAGLLLPHHIDESGTARYSEADAQAVRAGMTLLDAGLPLSELLEIAKHTDTAVRAIAEPAVEAFLRFVRDPVHGTSTTPDEAAERLVTAYQRMLPATETLVAHHLRRALLHTAAQRANE